MIIMQKEPLKAALLYCIVYIFPVLSIKFVVFSFMEETIRFA